jgi:hypothetical protein
MLLGTLARLLLVAAPASPVDPERDAAFETLSGSLHGRIDYDLPYPRWMFLNHLVERHDFLLHGSGDPGITEFEPRESTLWNGTPTKAVFATSDPIWPMFFSVINRDRAASLRQLCLGGRYLFSISSDPADPASWRDGVVYLLPRAGFRHGGPHPEWVSTRPVRPYAQLPVRFADFPFSAAVLRHRPGEGLAPIVWRLQRRRLTGVR